MIARARRTLTTGVLFFIGLAAGCVPVPVVTGGDMVVRPSPEASDAPARAIVLTFYNGYQEGFLDGWVLTAPEQRIQYPARFHLGFFALIAHGGPQVFGYEEQFGFVAFAPDRWPIIGFEWDHHPRLTRLYRRPDFGQAQAAIPSGAAALAEIGFHRRTKPWSQEVAGNVGAWDDLGWSGTLKEVIRNLDSLVATADRASALSDADRALVYWQMLEIVMLAGPMSDAQGGTEEFDEAQKLLRERLVALCAKSGEATPPAIEDEAAWLARIQADVSAHGIRAAAWQWMGPACDAGWEKCVGFLLSKGADANLCWDDAHPRPLDLASRRGHVGVARALLDAKVDVNAQVGEKDYDRHTALLTAVMHGRHEMAEFLLARGAHVNARSFQDGDSGPATALHAAAERDDAKMVEILLRHKADPNAADRGGNTALHRVANGCQCCDGERVSSSRGVGVVRELLQAGAAANAVNQDGETPLSLAARNDSPEVVSLLLKAGADPNRKDRTGRTPLAAAHKAAIKDLLREHGGKE